MEADQANTSEQSWEILLPRRAVSHPTGSQLAALNSLLRFRPVPSWCFGVSGSRCPASDAAVDCRALSLGNSGQ